MASLTTSSWQLSKLKNCRNCRIQRLRCCISREPFELESPNFTGTSKPTCPICAPDIAAKKTVENTASGSFRWNFSRKVIARITKFYTVVGNIWPHKSARYDVTSHVQSAFIEVRKTAENAASDGFGSNLSGTAFCLPHQMVGFLLINLLLHFYI